MGLGAGLGDRSITTAITIQYSLLPVNACQRRTAASHTLGFAPLPCGSENVRR